MLHSPTSADPRNTYRDVDLTSRIEGASPHRLVGIMFEELLNALAVTKVALRTGTGMAHADGARRAEAILVGLETSLDPKAGVEITKALAIVYREARRLLAEAVRTRGTEPLDTARRMIAEIATAWNAIG